MTWWLPTAVLLPYAGAALLPALPSRRSKLAGPIATGFAVATLGCVAASARVHLDHPALTEIPWAGSLGLSFTVVADGLSLLFALLVAAIGVVVTAYASAYLDETEPRGRFFTYLLLFMGSMLGLVTAANVIALFVYWELTSITSFLLIGFWHENDRSREGALKALVVTATGGLALLLGLVFLGLGCGGFDFGSIAKGAPAFAGKPAATAAAVLILAGILTKSAQLPFHLWLPSAMEAPTPVSAYLHAATMVKAGIYLAARLAPVLSAVPIWTPALTAVGLVTMTWAGLLALRQRDLKALLAFSTVSQLGLILALLASGQPAATAAGLLHVINHAAFKGALFLLVGIIEHETHTRDLLRLAGIARRMPWTAAAAVVACLSMAGIPPLGGFASKEMFLDWVLGLPPLALAVAAVGAAATAAYSLALAAALVLGHPLSKREAEPLHEAPLALLWGPALLSALALALGPAGQPLAAHLVERATSATGAGAAHVHIALWHGPTAALALSAAAVGAGLIAAATWWWRREPSPPALVADGVYRFLLSGLEHLSSKATKAYMTGLLWQYVTIVLVTAIGAAALAAFAGRLVPLARWPETREVRLFHVLVAAGGAAAAVGACLARRRLPAILALGANGYMLAVLFGVLAAPDLALTQVMVETVSVALFLAAFRYLPAFDYQARPAPVERWRVGVAAAVGMLVPFFVYTARSAGGIGRNGQDVASYYITASIAKAGGHNVVNVILVDFRGLDTLGEITVLAIAALACYAVVSLPLGSALSAARRWPRPALAPATSLAAAAIPMGPAGERRPASLILTTTAGATSWLLFAFAAILFAQGHNEPGGGFIAGLLVATGIVLRLLAYGYRSYEQTLGRALVLVATGLAIALCAAGWATAVGLHFFHHWFGFVALPLVGRVELATATLFDLGVFAVVVGNVLAVIVTISRGR